MSFTNSTKTIKYQDFELHYKGDISLLDKPKIAIVGTRRPSKYSKEITSKLSAKLSQKYVIVSGGAMGIDAVAHQNAKSTIMVSPSGLDVVYPKINQNLIQDIAKNHLILSEYEPSYTPKAYSFVQRNRIVVGISEFVIIVEADEDSGSIRSFEIAKKLGKKIYTIPHRIGESKGTNKLANTNEMEVIWDIEQFLSDLKITSTLKEDMDYNEALRKYGDRLFEMELNQEIVVQNGKVIFK